jgi:hypothetical protein
MNAAVSVAGLVKVFGGTRALDGLDLEVATGEVHRSDEVGPHLLEGQPAALASDAELLILDQPTSGLDPSMEAVFQTYIREDAPGADRVVDDPRPRGTRSGDRRTAGRRLRRVPDPRPQHRLSGPVHPLLVGGWPAARAFCAVAAS